MNYWTFKHKPGGASNEKEAKEYVETAIKLNAAIMQYEYDRQETSKVTQNWRKVQEIKEGDYIFLRGDENIYAVKMAGDIFSKYDTDHSGQLDVKEFQQCLAEFATDCSR